MFLFSSRCFSLLSLVISVCLGDVFISNGAAGAGPGSSSEDEAQAEIREEQRQEITANPGQTALLPCYCPEAASVLMLKVVKEGLHGDGYCFFYREGRPQESYQHLSFKNRVHLKDPQMKNGDFSVFLKNISLSDTGTYECVIGYEVAGGSSTHIFSHSNQLTVKDGHVPDRGHTGLILLSALLVLIF